MLPHFSGIDSFFQVAAPQSAAPSLDAFFASGIPDSSPEPSPIMKQSSDLGSGFDLGDFFSAPLASTSPTSTPKSTRGTKAGRSTAAPEGSLDLGDFFAGNLPDSSDDEAKVKL